MSPPARGSGASPLRHDRTVGRVRFALTGGVDLSSASPGAEQARGDVARELGTAALLLPRQVHGDRVVHAPEGWRDGPPHADGVLVTAPGVAVGVLAADCMPLLLGDPEQGVAAAVHVGRQGLHAGIVAVAVEALAAAGAHGLLALPGPTVCGGCYEVPARMRDEVAADVPAAAATTRHGTPSLDIPAGVRDQLARAAGAYGIDVALDESWCRCTMEDPQWFSHRRDAPTGRHAALVTVGGDG